MDLMNLKFVNPSWNGAGAEGKHLDRSNFETFF